MPPILYDIFHWPLESAATSPRATMVLLWIMFGAGAIFTGLFLVMRLLGRFHAAPSRAVGETLALATALSAMILFWADRIGAMWLLYLFPFPAAALFYAIWERLRPANGRRRARTRIRTPYLKMVLDHAAGMFDGVVMKGAYRGVQLSAMSIAELRLLQVEVSSDPDSVNILNAYLDHAHPGARRESAGDSATDGDREGGARRSGSAMSEDEAWSLLGLSKGASADDVKAAYRRLMKKVHPDHGGTDYLAHKISQAKELLLGL
jgi:hypothetical protein